MEEHLQSAISFLQTQQNVLERTVEILEGILEIVPTMKADVIRSGSKVGKGRMDMYGRIRADLEFQLKYVERITLHDSKGEKIAVLFDRSVADYQQMGSLHSAKHARFPSLESS